MGPYSKNANVLRLNARPPLEETRSPLPRLLIASRLLIQRASEVGRLENQSCESRISQLPYKSEDSLCIYTPTTHTHGVLTNYQEKESKLHKLSLKILFNFFQRIQQKWGLSYTLSIRILFHRWHSKNASRNDSRSCLRNLRNWNSCTQGFSSERPSEHSRENWSFFLSLSTKWLSRYPRAPRFFVVGNRSMGAKEKRKKCPFDRLVCAETKDTFRFFHCYEKFYPFGTELWK